MNEQEKQRRESLTLDWAAILDLALQNLHRSLWVGILENMEESLELLRYQTGLYNSIKSIAPTRIIMCSSTADQEIEIDFAIHEFIHFRSI